MPTNITAGAASAKGFGFSNSSTPVYVEDVFATTLYDGTGALQTINNGLALGSQPSWSAYSFYESSTAFAYQVVRDSSGNLYLAGYYSNTGVLYASLVKYDANGTVQWARRFNNLSASAAFGVAIDSANNLYITGQTESVSGWIHIVKYNDSGTLQWQRSLKENGSIGTSVHVDSTNNVYVAGVANDGVNYAIIAKYDTNGTIQWQRKFRQNNSRAETIRVASDGSVYVGGYATDASNNTFAFHAKYNSSGVLQWQRNFYYTLSSSYNTGCQAIEIDSSGNPHFVGTVYDGSSRRAYIAKYNSAGTLQWANFISAASLTYGQWNGIAIDASNNVYVGGRFTFSSFAVAKFDTNGALLWSRNYAGTNPVCENVAVDSSGNLFACGYSSSNSLLITATQSGSVVSGTAIVTVSVTLPTVTFSGHTDVAGTLTDAAGTATDSAGIGTGATFTPITSSATATAVVGKGGLAWIKKRGTLADSHALFDTERGATQQLSSNATAGASTQGTSLAAFNANGFTVGGYTTVGASGDTYAAWTFREQPKFLDVVTWTGDGVTTGRTIAHALGSAPGFVVVKRTSATAQDWYVWHRSQTGAFGALNTTAVFTTTGAANGFGNGTAAVDPTATNITVGSNLNTNLETYVAYVFAHNAGGFGLDGQQNVITCDSMTTSASASTYTTVNLGWEPQWLLIKNTTTTGSWQLVDITRGLDASGTVGALQPDSTNSTQSYATAVTINSQGFSVNSGFLGTSQTLLYVAIRRGPMRVPTSGASVFSPSVYTGTNTANRQLSMSIRPDMVLMRQRDDAVLTGMVLADRVRGQPYWLTGSTTFSDITAAAAFGANTWTTIENGIFVGNDATAKVNVSTIANNQVFEAFRRAPRFFDIVTYSGTGAVVTVNHNLGAVPKMMILKNRSNGTNPVNVYHADLGNTNLLPLNLTSAAGASSAFNFTTPTASIITIGSAFSGNGNDYIVYLFGDCPGVSKIGSYTGTGATLQINCGFAAGARFVLIRRSDSPGGDWYVWDTARGINAAANDPYLLLNSAAAETTTTDYINPYSLGFEVSSTAPAALNAVGGTFVYLAIA